MESNAFDIGLGVEPGIALRITGVMIWAIVTVFEPMSPMAQHPDPMPGARLRSLPRLYLASQSPRRKSLLQSAGLAPMVLPTDAGHDPEALELPLPKETPRGYVCRVAIAKRDHALDRLSRTIPGIHAQPWDLVIAADTTVALGKEILGKPVNDAHAKWLLGRLSGKTHDVFTAVAISRVDCFVHDVVISASRVTFARLPPEWIDAYVASGEPRDKAGAYGIQGAAGTYIPRIEGSYSGIMGLPLYETLALIQRLTRHGQSGTH